MQQQMSQQHEQLGAQQAMAQQMVLCPVRLVYETQILVQPGDQIQPNQTFFINPQNPPPWMQNSLQTRQAMANPVVYVHQLPNNLMSAVQQPMDQNQLYLPQNFGNFQIQQQMLTQGPQEMRTAMQLANIVPNIVQNIQTNVSNDRSANQNQQIQLQNQIVNRPVQNQMVNPAVEVQRQVIMRPQMHQQTNIQRPMLSMNQIQNMQQQTLVNMPNVGQSNVGQTFVQNIGRAAPTMNNMRTSIANNVMSVQPVAKIREASPSDGNKTTNNPIGNVVPNVRNFVPNNYYRPIQPRPQVNQNIGTMPKTQQHIPVQTLQNTPSYTHDKNVQHNTTVYNQDKNVQQNTTVYNHDKNTQQNTTTYSHDKNVQQNTATYSHDKNVQQNTATYSHDKKDQQTSPVYNHEKNVQQITPVYVNHEKNIQQTTAAYNHEKNVQQNTTVYNHDKNVQQNTVVFTYDKNVQHGTPVYNQDKNIQQNISNNFTIIQQLNNPIVNRKRKSESPDEIQKKMAPNVAIKQNYLPPQAITVSKLVSEIGTNTSPIHKTKVTTQLEVNYPQPVMIIDNTEENLNKEVQDKDKLIRNTVYPQARGRVLQDKIDEIKPSIEIISNEKTKIIEIKYIKPESHTNVEVKPKPIEITQNVAAENTNIAKDVKDKIVEKVEAMDIKEETTNAVEEDKKMDVDKEEKPMESNRITIKQENINILTHVVDGYVIQESNFAFPIRRPLKEKTLHINSKSKETEKRDLVRESIKEELKNNVDIPLLPFHYLLLDSAKEEKERAEEREIQENKEKDNPFTRLQHTTVKSWTVGDLSAHLLKFNWKETVSLLQDHEIDGESLYLVSKQQLVTIGVTEEHADVICEFVKS